MCCLEWRFDLPWIHPGQKLGGHQPTFSLLQQNCNSNDHIAGYHLPDNPDRFEKAKTEVVGLNQFQFKRQAADHARFR